MIIPKVIFKKMDLNKNINRVIDCFYENDESLNIHDDTLDYYPSLLSLKMDDNEEVVTKRIKEVVTDTFNNNYKDLENYIKKYNEIWEKYNDKYIDILSNYLKLL